MLLKKIRKGSTKIEKTLWKINWHQLWVTVTIKLVIKFDFLVTNSSLTLKQKAEKQSKVNKANISERTFVNKKKGKRGYVYSELQKWAWL